MHRLVAATRMAAAAWTACTKARLHFARRKGLAQAGPFSMLKRISLNYFLAKRVVLSGSRSPGIPEHFKSTRRQVRSSQNRKTNVREGTSRLLRSPWSWGSLVGITAKGPYALCLAIIANAPFRRTGGYPCRWSRCAGASAFGFLRKLAHSRQFPARSAACYSYRKPRIATSCYATGRAGAGAAAKLPHRTHGRQV